MNNKINWISTEMANPNPHITVLISWTTDIEKGINVGFLQSNGEWVTESDLDYVNNNVTHWAFLPEHPLK